MELQGNLERLINKYLGENGVCGIRELCSINACILTQFDKDNKFYYIGFINLSS